MLAVTGGEDKFKVAALELWSAHALFRACRMSLPNTRPDEKVFLHLFVWPWLQEYCVHMESQLPSQ